MLAAGVPRAAVDAVAPPMHPTGRDLAKMTPAGSAAGEVLAALFGPVSRVARMVGRLDEEMERPHGPGCTLMEPCTECRPPASPAGPATPAVVTTCCGGTNLQPHRPGCPSYRPVLDMVRRLDAEMLQMLVDDARQQLDNVRGRAQLFLHRADLIEQAEAGWRRDNPGLSRLLQMADGDS